MLVGKKSVTGDFLFLDVLLASPYPVTRTLLVGHWSVTGSVLIWKTSLSWLSVIDHCSLAGLSLVGDWSFAAQSIVSHLMVTGLSLVANWSVACLSSVTC